MRHNESIKLAFHLDTQKVIHIDNAENGKSCNCECLECHEKLIAVQGAKRDKHFRHDTNISCSGSQETALHQLGKQIIYENSQIEIPDYGLITYSDTILEKKFNSTKPDVTAVYNGQNIFFEIAVKHFNEDKKDSFFRTGHHRSVEIDLSDVNTDSFDDIKNFVLNETFNKRIIFWENKVEHNNEPNWFESIAIVAAIVGFCYFLFKGKRR